MLFAIASATTYLSPNYFEGVPDVCRSRLEKTWRVDLSPQGRCHLMQSFSRFSINTLRQFAM